MSAATEAASPVRKCQPPGAALPTVLRHDRALLLGRHLGGLARVEAHGQDLVVGPRLESQGAHAAHEAVGRHAAEHRAVEVDEGQDDGALPEVPREADALARLVAEDEIERDRLAELLVEADVLDRGRRQRGLRRRRARSSRRAQGHGGSEQQREEREPGERDGRHALHGAVSAAGAGGGMGGGAGRPRRGDDLESAFDRHARDGLLPVDPGPGRELGLFGGAESREVGRGIRLQVRPGRHARLPGLGERGRRGILPRERALEKDRDAPHEAHDDERDGHEAADEAENAAEIQLAVDRPAAGFGGAGRLPLSHGRAPRARPRGSGRSPEGGIAFPARARTPRATGRRERRAS